MPKTRIEVGGDTKDLLNFYKQEHQIYGRCPHCEEPFRLSQVKLTYGKHPPKDLISSLKKERDRLLDQLEKVELDIEDLQNRHEDKIEEVRMSFQGRYETEVFKWQERMKSLNEKWEGKVDVAVDRETQKRIKQIRKEAVERSRVTLIGKTIERIAPMFRGFGHRINDVRPMFDPIDFIVFRGLYEGDVSDITFVEFKTGGARMSGVQKSIKDAVDKGRIKFEQRRIAKSTLDQLGKGRIGHGKQVVEVDKRR